MGLHNRLYKLKIWIDSKKCSQIFSQDVQEITSNPGLKLICFALFPQVSVDHLITLKRERMK